MNLALEIFTALSYLLAGWLLGGLVNYLADALPASAQGRFATPACPACSASQPLRRYLPWPRPCPACGLPPARRRWLAQLAAPLLAFVAWLQPPPGLEAPLALLSLAYFGLVLIIDLEHRLILHLTSLFGLALGLAAGWARQGLAATLLGGLAALLILLAIYLLGGLFGRLLSLLGRRRIDEPPFGFGDVMLGTVVGLLVGWPDVLGGLLAAILAAGLFSLVYLVAMLVLRRYRLGAVFPFAPFLILGALWALYR